MNPCIEHVTHFGPEPPGRKRTCPASVYVKTQIRIVLMRPHPSGFIKLHADGTSAAVFRPIAPIDPGPQSALSPLRSLGKKLISRAHEGTCFERDGGRVSTQISRLSAAELVERFLHKRTLCQKLRQQCREDGVQADGGPQQQSVERGGEAQPQGEYEHTAVINKKTQHGIAARSVFRGQAGNPQREQPNPSQPSKRHSYSFRRRR